MKLDAIKPGMRLYSYWNEGGGREAAHAIGVGVMVSTVIRVNRKTVTVLYDGLKIRVEPQHFDGEYLEEDEYERSS